MSIPIGAKYTTTASGSAVKEVACENCGNQYLYQVDRKAVRGGVSLLWQNNQGAQDRSNQAADEALERELAQAIDPVACPTCGWLQASMCQPFKRRRLYIGLVLTFVIAASLVGGGVLISLEFHPDNYSFWMFIASACIAVVGVLGSLAWWKKHNPNRKHPGKQGQNLKAAAQSKGIAKPQR